MFVVVVGSGGICGDRVDSSDGSFFLTFFVKKKGGRDLSGDHGVS